MLLPEESTYQTKEFILTAALHLRPARLCISLQYLKKGVAVYGLEYRPEDIGDQICTGVLLEDIFNAITIE